MMKKINCGLNKFITLIAMLFIFFAADSESLNKYTFIISDYSHIPISEKVLDNGLKYNWSGLAISLNYNKDEDNLILNPIENNVTFKDFINYLSPITNKYPEKIIPLFIDYSGPVAALKESFLESGMSEKLYFLPYGERWPMIEDILAAKKNLIVFTFQKVKIGNTFFHYAWDYIAEYPNSGIEDPLFDGYFPNGDISKELLLVRDLEVPSIRRDPDFILDINQNQYYINHLLNRWKHTGKHPNFIFTEKNTSFLSPIFPWLNTYKSISGVVKIGEKPLEKVYWQHSNRCISNGYFNFPYLEGEELNLTPYYPGFNFNPKSITINNEHFLSFLTFNAKPLELIEGLTGYFPFDNSWFNYADRSEKINPVNASFINDVNRGEVAKLSEDSYVEIGSPVKYGIRGNSFTVSAWIKLNESDTLNDQSILGTNEGTYRKGLHLVIREQRPYFGFFGNDQWAEKIVPPQEWHHIVFRYNYFNGEQAIYYDGRNVGASFNHSSFIGDSVLQIGKALRSENFLNGYMDDLFIWNRALGEEEIQILYNSGFKPDFNQNRFLPFLWGILIFIAFIFIIVFVNRSNKRNRKNYQHIEKLSRNGDSFQKNALFLFGEFQLYNSKGEELSGQFTPKIKELFLLLLISSIKNEKGIKTEKLTTVLWTDFTPGKAANNRGVTFNKLRKIIEQVEGLDIVYNNGYWKIIFDKNLYFDYLQAFSIISRNNPSKNELNRFFQIVKKGVFLSEIHWEWLDEIRGFVANEIIDNLLIYCELLNSKDESQLLKSVAERILAVDDLHEKAQKILITILIESNNLNLAKYQFNLFRNNYQKVYGEEYKHSFEEFVVSKQ